MEQLIKTTMWDQYAEITQEIMGGWGIGEGVLEKYEVLFGVWEDWKEVVGESVFEKMCPEFRDAHPAYFDEYDQVEGDVLDKMIVSYITGKTRIIQNWVRSINCRAQVGTFWCKVKKN